MGNKQGGNPKCTDYIDFSEKEDAQTHISVSVVNVASGLKKAALELLSSENPNTKN